MLENSPLRQRRLDCGLTQTELAARAGVSRQLVAAVEAGRNVPAVDAALAIARVLATPVEELFAPGADGVVGALGDEPAVGRPLRVGRVGEQLVAAELADHGVSGAGWGAPDGVIAAGGLELFPGAVPRGLVIAGCDPAFGIAERLLEGLGPRSLMAVSAPTGIALSALSAGRIHAAVVHGRSEGLPPPPVPVTRWHFAKWEVGLAVAQRGAAGSLEAVLSTGAPFATRDSAAASQQALERARRAAGLPAPKRPVHADGHLEAARLASILRGAGVTTASAARAFGLRFIELEEHAVEVWIDRRWSEQPGIQVLGNVLAGEAFKRRVAQFGGYDLSDCGHVLKDN